jgi:SAM-dependent methyltransferase
LGFAFPLIAPELLLKFYQQDYHSDPQSYSSTFFTRHINPAYLSQALNTAFFADVSQKPEVNYLDIGCGAFGHSFNAFSKVYCNKKINYFGIDADPVAKRMLTKNGITWLGDDYHSLNDCGKLFDIITMSHCLEHFALEDALFFLKKVKNFLAKEGVLFIEVPHDDFRNKQRQSGSSSPHTIFFTPASLSSIAASSGYSVLFCSALGPGMEDYAPNVASNSGKTKKLIQYCKSFVPVHTKEKLKNIFGENSMAGFLKKSDWINSKGVFLRILLRNKE